MSALSWPAESARTAPQATRIHYINVGQADAILLEFDKAAIMIDAGGEDTDSAEEENHLVSYIDAFFTRRSDLNRTIHTIIVSHPHIDHTKKLMDIVKTFSVKNLIDGGDSAGSGIGPLKQAREYVSSHGGNYYAINDVDVKQAGFINSALEAIHALVGSVKIQLLSGSRNCHNANNSSLIALVTYKTTRFIFTGDAEDIGDDICADEITEVIDRYKGTDALKADVLKVDHHGSDNGSDTDWLTAVSPMISIISAGKSDPAHRQPGSFHAWQFGHPRESAVRVVEAGTTGTRTPSASVITMDAVKQVHANRPMTKAVYCTCWDGNIVVEPREDGGVPAVKTGQ
jgi:competence protein ComEC